MATDFPALRFPHSPALTGVLAAGLELFTAGLAWLLPTPLLYCLDAWAPLGPEPGRPPAGLMSAGPPRVGSHHRAAGRGWRGVAGRARRR